MEKGLRFTVAVMTLLAFCFTDAYSQSNGDRRKVYKDKRMGTPRKVTHSTHAKSCPRCSSGTIWGYRYVDEVDVDFKWQYQIYNGRRRRWENTGLPKWEYETTLRTSPTKIYWNTGCDNPDCSGEWAFLQNRTTYLLGGYNV